MMEDLAPGARGELPAYYTLVALGVASGLRASLAGIVGDFSVCVFV